MTASRRKEIGQLAEYVREKLDIQGYDFDTVDVVHNKLHGKIKFFSFHDVLKGDFKEEEVVKVSDESFEIRIDKNNHENRRKFSIAHELGHLFLHMGFGRDEWEKTKIGHSYQRRTGHYAAVEEDANEFAAAFLMPEAEFRKVVSEASEDGRCSIKTVADKFAVSEDAVFYRGRNLQLWS